uniref:Uncharacterized protein n=1 Tax=Panagrolaimus sp. ES5 TaxID=591445 RepID=A0AC34G1X3_9BILA
MSDQLIPPAIIHAPSSDFPTDVFKWIKENAEGKMALKSMKCHKYFQHPDFPYSIILNIAYNDREDKWDVMTLDGKKLVYYGLESIETAFTKKLWLIGSLALLESPNLVTRFITKIAVCDIKYLTLADQQFSFNDFLFLTSANLITHISLYNTVINDDNGDPIFIDSILKCLPNLTAFIWYVFSLF